MWMTGMIVHSILGLPVVSKADQLREGPALCCQCLYNQILTSGSGPAAAIQLPKPYNGSVSPAAAAAPAGNQALRLQACDANWPMMHLLCLQAKKMHCNLLSV